MEASKPIEGELLEVPPFTETKPGVRTTEFWTTLFSNLLGFVQVIFGPVNVSDGKVITVLGIINGAYAVGRGLAKQGQPYTAE